ncbi:regulatory protein RecX [uncultured Sphaerochaeta sp.]|uniref:regulatory protein RecX n=1 Tax=uncultured Sphaerochaeta sp. TaxID=886478 RepID=UPI003747FB9E
MELFLSSHLHSGQELCEEEFFDLQEKQQALDCRDQAMVYLARREHTAFELRQKLQAKNFLPNQIDWALDFLLQKGYLSELRYARALIASRQRKNPEGRIIMARRLSSKGVNRNDAQQALDEWYSEEQTLSDVLKANVRLSPDCGPELAMMKLQKKGFSRQEIKRALEKRDELE